MMDQITEYWKGNKLYGDDFSESEIINWYREEEEAYADLLKDNKKEYCYQYHAMNQVYGFSYVKDEKFENVLGIGSAYGHEFLPYISKIQSITILEPSENLRSKKLGHLVPSYIKPNINGHIPFPDNSFDLITSFSVLHHIPNVSYVLAEIIRVLKPNGFLLLREPIRTMGDWRFKRKGLTKNERGIPLEFFERHFNNKNLVVIKKSFCDCNFLYKILKNFIFLKRDTVFYQKIDQWVSKKLSWNIHYHPRSILQKISPATVFFVLKKTK